MKPLLKSYKMNHKTLFFLLPFLFYNALSANNLLTTTNPDSSFFIPEIVLADDAITFQQDGLDNVILVGGAAFNGKKKRKKAKCDFTQNMIFTFQDSIFEEGDFHVAKNSKRFLGIIRNSIYTIKFGNAQVDKLKKRKHKALRKTINELGCVYPNNVGDAPGFEPPVEPLNLIGSSYGSVLIAQAALYLTEQRGLTISSLTLSASSIDSLSALGTKLRNLESAGLIGKIVWHPNKDDNITGASGNRTLWKLIFPGSGEDSILSPFHAHNQSRKNLFRVNEIIDITIIDGNVEGRKVKNKAQQILKNREKRCQELCNCLPKNTPCPCL